MMGQRMTYRESSGSGKLKAIDLDCNHIPDAAMTLAVMALYAQGTTTLRNIASWRVKETDRIAAMVEELTALGGRVEAREDGMVIQGVESLTGGAVKSHGDHRIAMSMAVAALRASAEVSIDDTACTATSFPNFWSLLEKVRV